MKVFQNESEVEQYGPLGKLTVENRIDRVSLFGQIDITRDAEGLSSARSLLALLEEIVGELSAERRAGVLPPAIENKPLGEEDNPFQT